MASRPEPHIDTADPQGEREHAWRWRDAALGGAELLHARFVTHRFAPHSHEGYAFGVVESGAESFWYRGAERIAKPGDLIALNPDELHTGARAALADHWAYRMIYASEAMVARCSSPDSDQPDHMPFFPEPVIRDRETADAFCRLHAAISGSEGALTEATRFVEVLAQIANRHGRARQRAPRGADRGLAQRLRTFLDENYQRNVTLAELGEYAGVSPFHLAHVFRNAVGLPPHRYLEQRRVRHARALIAAGRPLSFAALDAGFNDQAHLTRHFKRHLGVTPGQYRRGLGQHRSHIDGA